ncbi:MAG: hypothetical protein ACK5RL_09465 [Acidimicrobiales bacterium]
MVVWRDDDPGIPEIDAGESLEQARALAALAAVLEGVASARSAAAATARAEWTGPKADTFDQLVQGEAVDAFLLAAQARQEADLAASRWAIAVGSAEVPTGPAYLATAARPARWGDDE